MFEQIGAMLDEIAAELPDTLYKELNGGVYLLPEAKLHPESANNDLFTLGEYRVDHTLGRYIVIFYGSFVRLYGRLPQSQQREELKKILHHELIHHLESLAGERGLEMQDERDIGRYKRNRQTAP